MGKSGYKIECKKRKRYGKWTETKEKWVMNHLNEYTVTEMAKRLHIHRVSLTNHLRKLGVKLSRKVVEEKKIGVCVTISQEAYTFLCRYGNKSKFIDDLLCQLNRKYGADKKEGADQEFDYK